MRNSFFHDNLASSLNDKEFLAQLFLRFPIGSILWITLWNHWAKMLKKKLFPEQQSGSCTMASLIGALLYFSDSMEDFHWYRLKIGHAFLENFLNRLQTNFEYRNCWPGYYSALVYKFIAGWIRRRWIHECFEKCFLFRWSQTLCWTNAGSRKLVIAIFRMQISKWIQTCWTYWIGKIYMAYKKKHDAINKLKSDQDTLLELKLTFI